MLSVGFVSATDCDAATGRAKNKTNGIEVGAEQLSTKKAMTAEQLFVACQSCHSITEGALHKVGPNLHGLVGQPAASREGYVYSKALTNSGIVWSRGLLLGWVLSTETMVPKTWMVYHNHLSVEDAERLVDYIIAKTEE